MKVKYGVLLLVPFALLLASCPLPTGPQAAATAAPSLNPAAFSVETDSARGVAVFVDSQGVHIDIEGIEEDGSAVTCIEASAAVPVPEEASAKGFARPPVMIVGARADGAPGIWIVTPDNRVQLVLDGENGKLSSCLPDTDEKDGTFRGRFGWAYKVMGISEDGRFIAGYAKHEKGFSHGRWMIDPGTTIGVYWRVWKHSSRPYWVVSHARIIGTYDPSKLPIPGKRSRLLNIVRHHKLEQLKWFLLDYLSAYFVMVDKDGIRKDPASDSYLVTGTDQDGEAAVATIDGRGHVRIEPLASPSDLLDLSPGALTSAASAADGTNLTVTLAVRNLQPGAVSGTFSIDFHLALSSSFDPASDTLLASVPWSSGIAGSSSVSVVASLPIPDTLDLNQVVYIYAVVDAGDAVAETDETNNITTASTSAVLLVYNDEDPSRSYPVELRTYSPSGSSSTDTLMALYRDNGAGTAVFLQGDNTMGPAGYAVIDGSGQPLQPGTYYAAVMSWPVDGPYAMIVTTAGIGEVRLIDLTSNSQDPYEPDDSPNTWPLTEDKPLPTSPALLRVGTAVARYAVNSPFDYDWFAFTLP